jgi:HK97 family phage portal protein
VGFFRQIAREFKAPFEKRSRFDSFDQEWQRVIDGWGMGSTSGKAVTANSAMKISAVYACVRLLSETIASLPLKLKRWTPKGSEDAVDHPLYRLLKDEPNERETSYEFNETMDASAELLGNAKARIMRDSFGMPTELRFVPSDDLPAQRLTDGTVVYRDGAKVLLQTDVLHIRGLSTDGLNGLSVLRQARDAIGVSMAAEEHGARFFGNGAAPGGVLEFPAGTKKEDVAKFMELWKEKHQGAENSYKAAALYGGIKYSNIGVSNEDAQFLATRQFQVEDIARFYGVPLVLLQSTEKSTSWGSGMEQILLAFYQFTIRPRLVRWEKRVSASLLTEAEKAAGYYVQFNFDALLRAAFKDRMDGYAVGLNNGIFSINEVRAKEDLNELPDGIGSLHMIPLNLAPAGQKPAEKQPKELPAPKDDNA